MSWILLRAFGPVGASSQAPGKGAAPLARLLDLAPRIAERTEPRILEGDLGAEGARALRASQGVAALDTTRLLDLCHEVAATAARIRVPVVFLKGMALHLTGRTPVGARIACDVDVLAPRDGTAALSAALRVAGFSAFRGAVSCDHQLTPLGRRPGETVEIHRFLPGIRLPGEPAFATAEGLTARDLLDRLSLPGEAWAPKATLLAAHALVHGIAQHGFAPRSYPMTRMLADLMDLSWGDREHEARREEALALVVEHVGREEALAAWDLCGRLRDGESVGPAVGDAGPPLSRLLAHVLAGALEAEYADSLKIRVLGSGPSHLPHPLAWARDAARAVWPTREQMEGLRGQPMSTGGILAARCARPFDLAGRAWRAARRAARVRNRARRP